MKIEALYDLQQEIDRLYVAGSKFAKNDPRLMKQLPILNKLGEKAPVFKKLAQHIEELLQSEAVDSSEKLLNAGILLYSILYTQGEMTEENAGCSELSPALHPDAINTSVSYLELKPVIEALSMSNQGRMGVIEEGFKRGIFDDFRTFEYLDRGLADKYSDLADYIEKTIIPSVGPKMLPFIKNNFSYEGQAEDVRRFRLLYQMKDKDMDGMIKNVLDGSAVNLQAEAVGMLADDVGNEALILKLADDKHKPVREAAYLALARLNTKASLEKLTQVFVHNKSNSNLPGIVAAIKASRMSFFFQDIYNKIYADFEAFIALENETDEKKLLAGLEKLYVEFPVLEGREEDYIVQFQQDILTHVTYNVIVHKKKGVLGDTAKYLAREIGINLSALHGERSRQALRNLYEHPLVQKYWWEYIANHYFGIAAGLYGKEKIYELFKDCYIKGKLPDSVFITTYAQGDYNGYATWNELFLDPDKIDKRWIDLFLKRGEKNWNSEAEAEALFLLLSCCGPKSGYGHKALKGYMEEVIKNRNLPYHALYIYVTDKLMESGMPARFELFTASLENDRYLQYGSYRSEICRYIAAAGYIDDFPKEYVARFYVMYQKTNSEYYLEITRRIEGKSGKIRQLINKIIK